MSSLIAICCRALDSVLFLVRSTSLATNRLLLLDPLRLWVQLFHWNITEVREIELIVDTYTKSLLLGLCSGLDGRGLAPIVLILLLARLRCLL